MLQHIYKFRLITRLLLGLRAALLPVVFLFLYEGILFAQSDSPLLKGMPIIRNYKTREYKAVSQNWAILEDKQGVMYFGNSDGVLSYDGAAWHLIYVPDHAVRSLAMDSEGRIYVGTINGVGYLEKTDSGMVYKSLMYVFPQQDQNLTDVWAMVITDNEFLVQTSSGFYRFTAENKSSGSYFNRVFTHPNLKVIKSEERVSPLSLVNGHVYCFRKNFGLQEFVNDTFISLPGTESILHNNVVSVLPYQGENSTLLLTCASGEFYLYRQGNLERFNTEADAYLKKAVPYFASVVLPDNQYALGTRAGGIVIIDSKGNFIRKIAKAEGLNDESVYRLFLSRDGNLWAALNNGIGKILISVPVALLGEIKNVNGVITALTTQDDILYVATHSSVYMLNAGKGSSISAEFKQVPGIKSQSWDLYKSGEDLLVPNSEGIFRIHRGTANLISPVMNTYTLYRSRKSADIYYVGAHDGLGILQKTGDSYRYLGKISCMHDVIQNIEEDSQGSIWLQSFEGDIYKLAVPSDGANLNGYTIASTIKSPSDFGLQLFRYNDRVYFFSGEKLLFFDNAQGKLADANLFNERLDPAEYEITSMVLDDAKSIWVIYKAASLPHLVRLVPENNRFRIERFPYLNMVFNDYSPSSLTVFPALKLPDKNSIWLSIDDQFLIFDKEKIGRFSSAARQPMLQEVDTKDKKIFNPLLTEFREFKFIENTIIMEYSLPSFINESQNLYSVFLEGFDNDWSPWTHETKKEYTNLPPGKYTFMIKGMNALGEISGPVSYQFKISAPWYRSWWSTILSLLIILSLLAMVIKYRIGYLERKNIELEKIISERTAQIRQQNEKLEAQAQQLRELDMQKTNFFSNITHEFRTPLTLIMGHLEYFQENTKDAKITQKLNIVKNNLDKLFLLINQILDLSRLRSGIVRLQFTRQNIVKFLKPMLASFDLLMQNSDITLSFTGDEPDLYAEIDEEKFREIISNLISNAIKFTPRGGSIEIESAMSQVSGAPKILITVKDTGIGIPSDQLPKIFDRFYQVNYASNKDFFGTGLGLSIVKELVELHNGTISVESKPGAGTTFSIFLNPCEAPADIMESDQADEPSQTSRKVVLIVEDDTDLRNFIKEKLGPTYRLIEAENGEQGLHQAREILPDLIISDVVMPQMDGFEFCSTVKNDPKTSHIPFIILTAKIDEESKLGGLRSGADDYLSKPFSSKELSIRVENLLRRHELLREKYQKVSVIRPEDVECNSLDKEFLQKVFAEIKDHLEDSQFGVDKLAAAMNMSSVHLNRKLNHLINQTAGKLIRHSRLDYAASLLEQNAGNVSEIAMRVGFSEVSNFTHSFKEKFGIPPGEYLKKSEEKS